MKLTLACLVIITLNQSHASNNAQFNLDDDLNLKHLNQQTEEENFIKNSLDSFQNEQYTQNNIDQAFQELYQDDSSHSEIMNENDFQELDVTQLLNPRLNNAHHKKNVISDLNINQLNDQLAATNHLLTEIINDATIISNGTTSSKKNPIVNKKSSNLLTPPPIIFTLEDNEIRKKLMQKIKDLEKLEKKELEKNEFGFNS
jgi:hypothetical protein